MSDSPADWPLAFLRDIEADEMGERTITSGQAQALREHIERLRQYATLLETTNGAVDEQAERWRKRLIELQGYADA